MNKAALYLKEESERSQYIEDTLSDEFELLKLRSFEEGDKYLKEHFDDTSFIIFDRPIILDGFKEILSYIASKNNYMFSLPALILMDKYNYDENIDFFVPPINEVICSNDRKEININRIKNAIRLANSTSFDEFSEMLKMLPSLVYLKDVEGRYAFCSQNWHHLKDQKKSIRGLTDFDIRKDVNNARIARESDLEVIHSGKGKCYTIKEVDEEGTDYLQIIKEPLKDEEGKVTGIIAIINNVTNEELLRQQLRDKSITDTLTGLYNRSYFEELTNWQSRDLGFPLTIISADCDDLKKINDMFGHAAGDQYICYARDALKKGLPEDSYIFRMGGDEFVAIVPATSKEQAQQIVNKINNAIEEFKNDKFALRLSVGSYTIEKSHDSIEYAVNLSDEDMYKTKKQHKLNQTK